MLVWTCGAYLVLFCINETCAIITLYTILYSNIIFFLLFFYCLTSSICFVLFVILFDCLLRDCHLQVFNFAATPVICHHLYIFNRLISEINVIELKLN